MKRTLTASLTVLALAAALAALAPGRAGVPQGSDPALGAAEALVAEGSFEKAREAYEALAKRDLPASEARWVRFRLADVTWRSLADTPGPDPTALERARDALQTIVDAAKREEDRDRVWAESEESLGDFFWTRRGTRDLGSARPRYDAALGFWAASTDLDLARERYLAIVWKMAEPGPPEPWRIYGGYASNVPLDVLENAARIAATPVDRAHARWLIAVVLQGRSGDPGAWTRTRDAFEAALAAGRDTPWHDDALYAYAQWCESAGRLVRGDDGNLAPAPDYDRALDLYRRLLEAYPGGTSRWVPQAKARVEDITKPSVGLAVTHAFLPGAEVAYRLSWRNVSRIDLALYPVDLTDAVRLEADRDEGWLESIDLAGRKPARRFAREIPDAGDHVPGGETATLDGTLSPGAYVLSADAGPQRARALVLVTDAAVVLESFGDRALAYVAGARDSKPVAGARVALWRLDHQRRNAAWVRTSAATGADGVAEFDLPEHGYMSFFAAATAGERQAFVSSQAYGYGRSTSRWKIYAFTDRPAYRPGDAIDFKVVARRTEGDAYRTPDGAALAYTVRSPRGETVREGTMTLNAFGAAWDSLTLGAGAALGTYTVTFRDPAGKRDVGSAQLFRLEEYRLPEFLVSVRTPEAEGRPRALLAGDTIEAEVHAEYAFGGPVAGADVQVVVRRRPIWIRWRPQPMVPWLDDEASSRPPIPWGGGEIVKQQTLETDASGNAAVRIETPAYGGQSLEYTVEARVTDASRREVVGNGTVRVGTQPFYAFVEAEHRLYRPGDRVEAAIRTQDVNDAPVAVAGRAVVTRRTWDEVWIDPWGREVAGAALEKAKRRDATFPPPPPEPGGPSWRLKFRGYREEKVLETEVATGDDGRATFRFDAPKPGYYRVAWTGEAERFGAIAAETTVWVTDREVADLGYRSGPVEIVLDREAVREGGRLPLLVATRAPDAHVLLTVSGDGLIERRLVHVTGDARLVDLDVDARFVPNVSIDAVMLRDLELAADTKSVDVPPTSRFLTVDVDAGPARHRPGETVEATVTTRDADGKPVPAEVALAVYDETVTYIQQDLAGDPRKFFWGERRPRRVSIDASLSGLPFAREEDEEIAPETVTVSAARADEAGVLRQGRDNLKVVAKYAPAPGGMAETEVLLGEPVPPGAEEVSVTVRTDFRATAFWKPDVVTGADGRATVSFELPQTLTTWTAVARAVDTGTRVGIGEAETKTALPMLVRLQTPRFLVAGDTAIVSAVVNNTTAAAADVDVTLDASGVEVRGRVGDQRVSVPAGGESRVDWLVAATVPGEAKLSAEARSPAGSDAMERTLPVEDHGIAKLLYDSGKTRGDAASVTIDLPAAREPGSTTMTVRVTPSLAVTMLDALPYLADYPYGCTEQTMSRFLPAVIVTRTLSGLGLDPAEVASRAFGGIEPEHAAATHPGGRKDLAKLDDMVAKGLARLADFQHGDGAWGWWKEAGDDPWMTAYVVWGLAEARDAGVRFDRGMLERGASWAEKALVGAEDDPDLAAFMLHAVALARRPDGRVAKPSDLERAAFDRLWRDRERLNAYGRALLTVAGHRFGAKDRVAVLVRNLENGVQRDADPPAAHWGRPAGWWRWSEGAVETTAFVVRALLEADPGNSLIDPAVGWLVRNRRGAQWSNTRDTAIAVLTLTDFLKASGELRGTLDYAVEVNGREAARRTVAPADLLRAPDRIAVDPRWLADGPNRVRIVRRGGDAPMYWAVEARFWSREEPVAPAAAGMTIERAYLRQVPHATLLRGPRYEAVPVPDRGTVASGDRLEVVLTIETKNDYEYLVLEDLKPAGFEAVDVRSGGGVTARRLRAGATARPPAEREAADYTGESRPVYRELRDRKVALFVDRLPQGSWEIRYVLRAEAPGTFHALPAIAQAMYVPEIRANGAEVRVEVTESDDGR